MSTGSRRATLVPSRPASHIATWVVHRADRNRWARQLRPNRNILSAGATTNSGRSSNPALALKSRAPLPYATPGSEAVLFSMGWHMNNKPKNELTEVTESPDADRRPLKVWAGRGSGRPCTYCQQPISAGEVEYEVAAQDGSPGSCDEVSVLRFHLGCHDAWRAGHAE
jgi:hypothetical protein